MSKLLYISHPCTSCGNIDDNRKRAAEISERVKKLGYCALNPLEIISPDMSHDDAMSVCISLLWSCDMILMCGDWKNSKGCMRELEYAINSRIPILSEDALFEINVEGTK